MEEGVLQDTTANGDRGQSAPETIMDREILMVSDIFGSGGHYQLDLSPDCSKLAIVRTDQNRFVIVSNTGGTSWTPYH